MALDVNLLGTPVASTVGATVYAHGSVNPTAGRGVIFAAATSGVNPASVPTTDVPAWLDGAGFTLFESAQDVGAEIAVFAGVADAGGADTVQIDWGADTQTGCTVACLEIDGMSPTDYILQAAQFEGTGTTTGALTLPTGLGDPANAVVLLLCITSQEAIALDSASGEELVDAGHATPGREFWIGWRLGEDNIDASWTNSIAWVALLLEIESATGSQVVAVGQALETDTAQSITPFKTAGVGLATETETAQSITPLRIVPVNQALETETAQPMTAQGVAKIAASGFIFLHGDRDTGPQADVNPAQETDLAQQIIPVPILGIGLVTETETTQSITPMRIVAVGQAVETDSAFAIAAPKGINVGQALETDTAQNITIPQVVAPASGQENIEIDGFEGLFSGIDTVSE